MKSLQDYLTKNENGEYVINEAEYKADLDRERNQASETARANAEKKLRSTIEAEIRAKIEEEAKLTAEEKLQKDREKLMAEYRAYNSERVKNIYKDSGLFTDEEIELYTAVSSDDFNKNIETAHKFVEARKKYNADFETKFTEKLQQGLPRTQGTGTKESDAARKAKSYAQNRMNDIVDL